MTLARKGHWTTVVGLVLLGGVYVRAVVFTPVERLQGPAQKIFYLHVPAAVWTELAMVLVGVASVVFLLDRKSTRLHSSHVRISYAVFCMENKRGLHREARAVPPWWSHPQVPDRGRRERR